LLLVIAAVERRDKRISVAQPDLAFPLEREAGKIITVLVLFFGNNYCFSSGISR